MTGLFRACWTVTVVCSIPAWRGDARRIELAHMSLKGRSAEVQEFNDSVSMELPMHKFAEEMGAAPPLPKLVPSSLLQDAAQSWSSAVEDGIRSQWNETRVWKLLAHTDIHPETNAIQRRIEPFLRSVRHFWGDLPLPALYILTAFVVLLCCSGCYCLFDCLGCAQFDENAKAIRQQHVSDGQVVFEWSQTTDAAIIYMTPPVDLSKRDLDIKIASQHLRVGQKGKPCIIKADIFNAVNKERSRWKLLGKGKLQIRLQKEAPAEWPFALQLHAHNANNSCRLRDAWASQRQPMTAS
mmetsp:Transcript_46318/g.83720  ORF Transcript_46318/g.83720 Transcript_46318/m.83720 type:complete len:296 (+) Transcript_46318:59-946(+)